MPCASQCVLTFCMITQVMQIFRAISSETGSERALRECLLHMVDGRLSEGKDSLLTFISGKLQVSSHFLSSLPHKANSNSFQLPIIENSGIIDFHGLESNFLLQVLQSDNVFVAYETTQCNSPYCPKTTIQTRRAAFSIA
jgi:hypothetical protein